MDSSNQSPKLSWQNHIKSWKKSGLSGNQYCKENELTYHQFLYWKKKLTEPTNKTTEKISGGFAKVIRHPEPVSDLTLTLPSGIVVRGISDVNVHLISDIIGQL